MIRFASAALRCQVVAMSLKMLPFDPKFLRNNKLLSIYDMHKEFEFDCDF